MIWSASAAASKASSSLGARDPYAARTTLPVRRSRWPSTRTSAASTRRRYSNGVSPGPRPNPRSAARSENTSYVARINDRGSRAALRSLRRRRNQRTKGIPASTRTAPTTSQPKISPEGTRRPGREDAVPGLIGLLLKLPAAPSLPCTVGFLPLPLWFLVVPPVEQFPVDSLHPSDEDEELMYVAITGFDFPGVGSNGSQPYPSNGTSTHAWRSLVMTPQVLSPTRLPGPYPMATRAGMPSERNITAIALANC